MSVSSQAEFARGVKRLKKLRAVRKGNSAPAMIQYVNDPIGYAREVLGVELWAKQRDILEGLCKPPYRVLARSSHSVGKSFCAAVAVCWWFDTFNPGVVITTAPTHRDVCHILWAEVRRLRQRAGLGGFVGDKAPELYDGPDHYAMGFTANRGESFQGRHPERLLLIFDEAVGIDPVFWNTARTMFDGSAGKHAWLAPFNPTDLSSQAYQEEQKCGPDGAPMWGVVEVSSPEHPNILAQLDGKPAPYPGAVTLGQFEDWLATWADPIDPDDAIESDLLWPPNPDTGRWYRPGPLMESRALGRYPSQSTYGVWSDRLWKLACVPNPTPVDQAILPEIGCDPARYGDDYTSVHIRWGHRSLSHERHNGWDTDRTGERLRDLAAQLADKVNKARPPQMKPVEPQQIPIKVDADGLGAGIIDHRKGFNIIGIGGSSTARRNKDYFNRRSELWFGTKNLAKDGKIDLSQIAQEHRERLRQQCFAPHWWPDTAGRCQVEPKDITKRRLGYSPDDADAMNLAYADAVRMPMASGVDTASAPKLDERKPERNIFGRR